MSFSYQDLTVVPLPRKVRPGLQREAGAGVTALHTVTAADYMQPPAQPKEDSRWDEDTISTLQL